MVGTAVWLVLVAYPSGESALYDWLYLLGAAAISVLAAVSLVRPDPLRLGRQPRPPGPPSPSRQPGSQNADAQNAEAQNAIA